VGGSSNDPTIPALVIAGLNNGLVWEPMAAGVALVSVEIQGSADVEPALGAMSRERPNALHVHMAVSRYLTRIVEHAAVHRLPRRRTWLGSEALDKHKFVTSHSRAGGGRS
jgi:hypothetical protein